MLSCSVFSSVASWDELSEERKVQLGFNMGVMALGLGLTKEEGFDALASAREGHISMSELHHHTRTLAEKMNVPVNEENVIKPF